MATTLFVVLIVEQVTRQKFHQKLTWLQLFPTRPHYRASNMKKPKLGLLKNATESSNARQQEKQPTKCHAIVLWVKSDEMT
jgi:hypothetical protein